ncbi:gem-associated protein 2-like [Schistocerca piceifrons]|uniref:gem-associated protein 2-like n=1 Tax=Schistocerca piceifrons TaxID=274613 RepID=UPI001F5F95F6|nr:gem-associated protein 2-like [Schistocerca piceifrons]
MGDNWNFLRRAFVVDDIPEDFDPSADPVDGVHYLQQVRWEASQCAPVVTAVIDEEKRKIRGVVNVLPECEKVPSQFLPDMEWQQLQVAHFSAVRKRVSKYRNKDPPQTSNTQESVPEIGDEKAWYAICVEYKIPPLLSVVLPLPQLLIEWLLQCNAEWLSNSEQLCKNQGRWVYALMACIELPLTRESCSSLRAIARECARIRAYENY